MTSTLTIATWRERIGATNDFPLHAPTNVERAMVAEIADLRAQLARQGQGAGYKEVGSFLYVGVEYVATSSDDPGGIKLYRPAASPAQAIAAQIAPTSAPVSDAAHSDKAAAANTMPPLPLKLYSEADIMNHPDAHGYFAADDVRAVLVNRTHAANAADLLAALRVLGITYDDEIPYNDGWFTAGSCMARATAEEAAQVALEMIEERYGILQQDYDMAKRDADREQTQAGLDVLAERRRQVEKEGYDPEHDDEHVSGEIAAYAAFYAMPPAAREWPASETGYGDTFGEAIVPADWKVPKEGDRRSELVKAGALILAEIERIDRAAMSFTQQARTL